MRIHPKSMIAIKDRFILSWGVDWLYPHGQISMQGPAPSSPAIVSISDTETIIEATIQLGDTNARRGMTVRDLHMNVYLEYAYTDGQTAIRRRMLAFNTLSCDVAATTVDHPYCITFDPKRQEFMGQLKFHMTDKLPVLLGFQIMMSNAAYYSIIYDLYKSICGAGVPSIREYLSVHLMHVEKITMGAQSVEATNT